MENTRDRILFITHKAQNCGVADYGLRVFNILARHGCRVLLVTPESTEEIDWHIKMHNRTDEPFTAVLYNYHYATLPFLTGKQQPGVKHVALFHEAFMNFEPDTIIPVTDLPRPLYEEIDFEKHSNVIPTIGSFGFGFPDKNFPGLCQMVKEQFEYAKVKLIIPFAEYGDKSGALAMAEAEKCKQVLYGTNIELYVEHDFRPARNLLYWLSYNDINIFNYSPSCGRGLSSATDYALSVKRPIGVSNSEMFRHLPKDICLDSVSIPELISRGIEPLKQVYEDNSNARLAEKIKSYL